MDVQNALGLIAGVSYKPGWIISAEASDRYDSAVKITVQFSAPNSNNPPEYPETLNLAPSVLLMVDDLDEEGLYDELLSWLIYEVEPHEAREFFRVNGNRYDAPFHPHTAEGMRRWAAHRQHRARQVAQEPTKASLFQDLRFATL